MATRGKTQPGDTRRTVEAGEMVVRQGDDATDMFVIRSGTVEISRGTGCRPRS